MKTRVFPSFSRVQRLEACAFLRFFAVFLEKSLILLDNLVFSRVFAQKLVFLLFFAVFVLFLNLLNFAIAFFCEFFLENQFFELVRVFAVFEEISKLFAQKLAVFCENSWFSLSCTSKTL